MNRFSRRHFPDLDIKELIHQYKQHDCLWNYNSPKYKCKESKQESWEEIANYFQKDVNEVKRKIKYLRSVYVGEKRKVDLSIKSGIETPYKPSLFYYNELNFLENIIVLRKFGSGEHHTDFEFENINILPDTEDNVEWYCENGIAHKTTPISCKIERCDVSELEIPISPIRNSPKMFSGSLASRTTKRSGEIETCKSDYTNKLSDCSSTDSCKDLYTSFGKTIALQLQQLPLEISIVAMSEIQTILTNKTIEHLKYLSTRQKKLCPSSEFEDSCNECDENLNDSS